MALPRVILPPRVVATEVNFMLVKSMQCRLDVIIPHTKSRPDIAQESPFTWIRPHVCLEHQQSRSEYPTTTSGIQ